MTLWDIVQTATPSLVGAVIGGLVVHIAAKRRDRANDQRRQRIDYLLSAYRMLARSAHRDLQGDRGEEFEDALSDVVVLGSTEQLDLAVKLAKSLAASKDASLDALLLSLRRELRSELGRPADGLAAIPVLRMSWGEARPTTPLRAQAIEVVFQEEIAAARAAIEQVPPLPRRPQLTGADELTELAGSAPGAAVASAYQQLHLAIASLLEDPGTADTVTLARRALDADLIAPGTFQSIEGISVLAALSHNEGRGTGLTPEQARDFLQLVQAVIFLIAHTNKTTID